MSERIDFNRDWEFTERFDNMFLHGAASPEITAVSLPHTCRRTPLHYFDESEYQMVCGYRKRLSVPESWRGRRVFLHVGAAAHSAEVYVNGKKLGEHHCGYTAFCTELTAALIPGEEALLAICVDSREQQDIPPFGYVIDYMTYGGLYREVWLEVREQSFIEDVFVMPRIPAGKALLTGRETEAAAAAVRFEGTADSRVTLCGAACRNYRGYRLRQRVYHRGREDETSFSERVISLDAPHARAADPSSEENAAFELSLPVPGAALWDALSPCLYTLRTELLRGEEVVDSVDAVFGFRRAEFRAGGFYLNGRKFKLRGLNRHQSYPYVGYAMPRSVQRFDADILKNELGVNAVRTSHYPQSPHFIERCDELGLLVFTEIPGWQHIGGADWKRQAQKNTEDMVLQYRNHPSIILWGVRINESKDDDAFYTLTNAIAHRLDPTRQTGGVRAHKQSSLLEDVYTYNDFVHDGGTAGCEKKSAVTSDMGKGYLVTEYGGHMFPTKMFDSEEHRLAHALRHTNVLDAVAAEDDIAGSFGWCMFDYNTHRDFGSGDRVCYHGVMDMFRNPKLAAGVYAAMQDKTPVLRLSSTMDVGEHPASNRGRVFVFTNADAVRMYKNDVFIREFTHADSPYKYIPNPPIEIDDYIGGQIAANEPFTPHQVRLVKELLNYCARFGMSHLPLGMLLRAAVLMLRYRMSFTEAYALYGKYIGNWGDEATVFRFEAVKNGEIVQTIRTSPVTERRLTAEAAYTELCEGATYDAALVRIAMRDQNGNVLPFYDGAVQLSAEGPIEILGPASATLRGGYGGTFVRTIGQSGRASLTLAAEGAPSVTIEFTIRGAHDAG